MMLSRNTEQRIAEIATIDNCSYDEAEQALRLTEPVYFEIEEDD